MKIRLIGPSFLGVSAMLIATCGLAAAQTAPQNTMPEQNTSPAMHSQNTENLQLVSANAQLVKGVNAKDASQGQTVKAKLTSDVKLANGMKLDEGAMLIGKVDGVQKSMNDGPSKISITFDQLRTKDGKTVPVKATLLGAYPANTAAYWVDTSSNGALMPIQPHTIPSDQKIDQEPGSLSHIAMHSAVQSNASGVFMSKDQNVNLKRGTRLQVAIAPETMTAG